MAEEENAGGLDGFWARTACLLIVVWPAGAGYLSVSGWVPAYIAESLATVLVSGCLFVAGLLGGGARLIALPAPWKLVLSVMVLGAFVLGTATNAIWPRVAIMHGFADTVLVLGAVGAFLLVRVEGERAVWRLLHCLLMASVVYFAFYAVFFTQLSERAEGHIVYSFYPFINIRRFTNVLAPLSAIAVVLWAIAPNGKSWQWFVGICATFFISFLMWSGGRGPTFAVFLALCVLATVMPTPLRLRLIAGTVFTFAIGSAVTLWLPRPDVNFDVWTRIFGEGSVSLTSGSIHSRLWLWRETVIMIFDHPWIGHGYKQWVFQRTEFINHGSAHNFPIQIVFDLGLIGGGAAVVLAFGAWFGHLRRLPRAGSAALVALAGLSVMMVQSFVDGIFSGRPSLQLVLLLFALAAALREEPGQT